MISELRDRLHRELEDLVDELTVNIPARLGTDQRPGEYQDTIVLQELVRGRIRHLRRLVAGLDVAEPEMLPTDAAGLGSVVRVRERAASERALYVLMAEGAADEEAEEVSLDSPLGRALAGRRPGDEVEVAGYPEVRRLRVLSLTTLFERVAGHDVPGPAIRLG